MSISSSFIAVLLTVFASFNAMYSPQPLLPFISNTFEVTPTTSALLLTVPFVLLCFSPVLYGAVLQRINARPVLICCSLMLAVTQVAFALASNFQWLMISRTIQAFIYPAIFTAAVTYCSKAGSSEKLEHRISLYVASTIVGGLSGRLSSGYITSWLGWPVIFILNAALLFCCATLLYFSARDALPETRVKSGVLITGILRDGKFISGYLLIFTTFFAFSAILNALPFRMVDIDPSISPAGISLAYSGYILGVIIATNSQKLCRLAGGRVKAMTLSLIVFLIAILSLLPEKNSWLIALSFATASCMFMIHSTLSSYLTSLMPSGASLINGLYISIYYAAGALGSVLPLWIYNKVGWTAFTACLFFVSLTGLATLKHLSFLTSTNNTRP